MPSDRGKPIAVAIGHHPNQTSTLATAISLGNRLGVELIAIHVINVSDDPIDPDSMDFEVEGSRLVAEVHDNALSQLDKYQHGWRWKVSKGSVADQIVSIATEGKCQLIVVGGGRRRHGSQKMATFHSTTARQIISISLIPTLVVPSEG
jgi:nucleotide-binding universal stress UspA family protein